MARTFTKTIPASTENGQRRTYNINIESPMGGDVHVVAFREEVVAGVASRDGVPSVLKNISASPDDVTVTFEGITANARQIAALCALMIDKWEEESES